MSAPLILVVDDVAELRAPLVSLLQRRGYRTMEAATGREALEVLKTHRDTALVVLDLFMPTLDGWAFRDEQLRDPVIAHIPVVVLSVAKQTELVGYSMRASAVLIKPLSSVDDIFAAVEKCCGPGLHARPLNAEGKAKWAAAFLRGRAKAFQKGNVPYADLRTAIRLAYEHHVDTDVIRTILAMHNLAWDSASGVIRTLTATDGAR